MHYSKSLHKLTQNTLERHVSNDIPILEMESQRLSTLFKIVPSPEVVDSQAIESVL